MGHFAQAGFSTKRRRVWRLHDGLGKHKPYDLRKGRGPEYLHPAPTTGRKTKVDARRGGLD